jgi:hypothetical protein
MLPRTKGHQDDNANAKLSVEALLNIEADCLAGDFQEREGRCRPIVSMFRLCLILRELASPVIYSITW